MTWDGIGDPRTTIEALKRAQWALLRIRNETLIWKMGTERDLLRKVHRLASAALNATTAPTEGTQ